MAMTLAKSIENHISYLKELDKEFRSDNLSITEEEYIEWINHISKLAEGHPYLKERVLE